MLTILPALYNSEITSQKNFPLAVAVNTFCCFAEFLIAETQKGQNFFISLSNTILSKKGAECSTG